MEQKHIVLYRVVCLLRRTAHIHILLQQSSLEYWESFSKERGSLNRELAHLNAKTMAQFLRTHFCFSRFLSYTVHRKNSIKTFYDGSWSVQKGSDTSNSEKKGPWKLEFSARLECPKSWENPKHYTREWEEVNSVFEEVQIALSCLSHFCTWSLLPKLKVEFLRQFLLKIHL